MIDGFNFLPKLEWDRSAQEKVETYLWIFQLCQMSAFWLIIVDEICHSWKIHRYAWIFNLRHAFFRPSTRPQTRAPNPWTRGFCRGSRCGTVFLFASPHHRKMSWSKRPQSHQQKPKVNWTYHAAFGHVFIVEDPGVSYYIFNICVHKLSDITTQVSSQ